MLQTILNDSKEHILNICYSTAGNHRIVAACLYGPLISGYGDEKSDVNILLVLKGFPSRLKNYAKRIGDRKVSVLAVDQGTFQTDVSTGWFGEVAADKLLIPYEPLINSDYLCRQEVILKKRIAWELLESIVLEFPELSQELSIRQEYFMYETQLQRAKVFHPIAYRFFNMMQNELREKNTEMIMNGYRKALEELSQEKWIALNNEMVKITPKLVHEVKKRKIRFPTFLRSAQRAAFQHLFGSLPKVMLPLLVEEEVYSRNHVGTKEHENITLLLENSKNHLLMPTPLGPVPLSDTTTIEEFVRKSVPGGIASHVEVKEIGGVLNSVYSLSLRKDHEQQRIVVKKFKDWTGFKWFPLALWSLGTKSFAVLGKSRLEREYALNQYLQSKSFTVPKILYISPKEHLIFQEFVEGQTIAENIKKLMLTKASIASELQLVKDAGRQIAQAHQLGVGLGDCKPENIIVTKDGKLCFVDLEQASRTGNQAWDIAEFLYYSGHYVPPLAATDRMEQVAKAFLEGYIEAGGSKENIKKAASPRYTKVFSIFTQPHVILAISLLCRKVH